MTELLDAALRLDTAGLSVVPAKADGSKRPFGPWTQYQTERATAADLTNWLGNSTYSGIGVICGGVSGRLEMFEAEGRAVAEGVVTALGQAMTDNGFADLWLRICTGYVENTPSGGIHWYYRIADGAADRNLKLARRPATDAELADKPDDKVKVLLETRGEGGFSITAPSAGTTHPDGLPWTVAVGSPETIPAITVGERDVLHSIAATLDQLPALDEPDEPRPTHAPADGLRPGDDYNQRATWTDILTPHGWRLTNRYSRTLGWCRPGKDGPHVSATTGRNDADNLYVFSTSTIFETEKPYSKFGAYALLEHGGDYSAAAKELRALGYGEPAEPTPPVTTIEGEPDETHDDAVRRLFPRLDWEALWADETEEEWIVEPLLPARRLVALYSAPKVGKSLLMLEIAVAVATGRQVLGTTPDHPRRVLYVDFENDPKADIRERLQAMGYKPADLDNLVYLSFPSLRYLDAEPGSLELIAAIETYQCEVVVIDTVSRAVGGDENENDTWLNFYKHTGIKIKRAGVALIRLDHSGKDETKGQRGGSAKGGDVDAVWRLSTVVKDQTYRLDCDMNRMQVYEKTITLHREALPHLHHRVDPLGRSAAFNAQVEECVRLLDSLEVNRDLGRDKARALLKEAGHKARNGPLSAAIKVRKPPVPNGWDRCLETDPAEPVPNDTGTGGTGEG